MVDIISHYYFPWKCQRLNSLCLDRCPISWILMHKFIIYILSATCLCQKWHAFKTFFKDRCHTVINDGYLDQYIACFVHLNVKNASLECEIINYLYKSWDYDCRGIKIFFTHLHDQINKTPLQFLRCLAYIID